MLPQTPAEGGQARAGKGREGRAREEGKKTAAFLQILDPSGREIFRQTPGVCMLTSRCWEVRRSNGSESERAEKTPTEKGTL